MLKIKSADVLSKTQMKSVRGGLEGFSIWSCYNGQGNETTICEPGAANPVGTCGFVDCTLLELATSCASNGCGGIVP
jgi:hypothetical protein